MTMRWFKFCVDSSGNVPGNRVPGYTVEQATMRALDMLTARPAYKNGPSFEIPLKIVETTVGRKHTAYYRIGICRWYKPDIEETYEYGLLDLVNDEDGKRELKERIVPEYRYVCEVYKKGENIKG